ncbi:FAD-dependent oxidoreductase [Methylobacterium nodulans]|uniref:Protein FixC n=1 Tax=Methylobacterium nodulans (strain LMG 21967 / CNCM I-2342 / ORS 2060) TaxID=460265 RepID=B8ITI1_METNO|nr:FAD-dependent oxidoreductase [Methylobacterium nodulans]ACL58897.1 FAD dependent oxidoreductase [Methylobacterium nodulans ORS 2060]
MSFETFDAIVVGAGMSGNACAFTLAKRGLKVLQLERGETAGSKNVQGAILYADMLEQLVPDFRDDAPLERHVLEQRLWIMDGASHVGMHYRSDNFNEEKPNRYTIIRTQFDRWFSRRVQEAGVTLLCETTATELIRDLYGRVVGVRTDRAGDVVLADVVVLAEGVNGLLGSRAGLRPIPRPEQVALAVKEMHFLPSETIDTRFTLREDEGVVIEAIGTISKGMTGMAFLYTNKESLSVGLGCLVSDYRDGAETPYSLLDAFKKHPSIAPLLAGSEVKEYTAHLIPEGGYKAIPQLYGDGWLVVGDAAQFNNALHREGSNLAMTTGRLAAETIIQLKAQCLPPTAANLALYREMVEDSFVMEDMKKYKDMPALLHTHSKTFFLTYPELMSRAAQNFLRINGVPKREKERATLHSFVRRRSWPGLIGDAVRVAQAWR